MWLLLTKIHLLPLAVGIRVHPQAVQRDPWRKMDEKGRRSRWGREERLQRFCGVAFTLGCGSFFRCGCGTLVVSVTIRGGGNLTMYAIRPFLSFFRCQVAKGRLHCLI
ncbi:hypothetical protein ACQJBY_023555 [Aegilops geniculata]